MPQQAIAPNGAVQAPPPNDLVSMQFRRQLAAVLADSATELQYYANFLLQVGIPATRMNVMKWMGEASERLGDAQQAIVRPLIDEIQRLNNVLAEREEQKEA